MLPDNPVGYVRDKIAKLFGSMRMDVTKEQARRLWVETDPRNIRAALSAVKANWPDTHLSTITGLDDGEFMELIYHFVVDGVLVNLKVKVPSKEPKIDTVSDILLASDSYERELHDLLGVYFWGRESTPRLVLPDEWQSGVYPLRKEAKGGPERA